MYRIARGSALDLPDVNAFVERLGALEKHPEEAARALFDPRRGLTVARAPGRLDLMGGIADYSGSLVLQWPLREAALVAVQADPERRLRLVSLGAAANGRAAAFEMPLDILDGMDYEGARTFFARDPATAWAAYVAGAFLVLRREAGAVFPQGARILIDSAVPEGKGVSSSAALEVAAMQAVAAAFDIPLEGRRLALLCQTVENRVVGAPCGIMDQMTAACGQDRRLLALLCQPAELQESVALPEGLAVWGLDSGIRHSVAGADYGSVRVGAFMGYRIVAEAAGLASSAGDGNGPVAIEDPRWHGYLANIPPSLFAQRFAARLPETLAGADFLRGYGNTTDPVTRVDPQRAYAVRVPATHPVAEHFRVNAFAELLAGPPTERRLRLLGELMFQSHASYSACGLGSDGTDDLVERVRAAGPAQGLYGAKITGGGSGGTVAVLGRAGAEAAVEAIAVAYARDRGYAPYVFRGSSPGAVAFGHLSLEPA